MSAQIHRFRGTEADSEAPPVTLAGEVPPPALIDDADLDAELDSELEAAGWPTTRRFSRSAHGNEAAWPDDAQYADALCGSFAEQDRSRRELSWKWADRAVLAILAVAMTGLALGWWI